MALRNACHDVDKIFVKEIIINDVCGGTRQAEIYKLNI